MSTIKINVNKHDIKDDRKTRHGAGDRCMLAQAITRRLDLTPEMGLDLAVGYHEFSLSRGGKVITTRFDSETSQKIRDWDHGRFIGEFTTEVEFPDDWRKQLLGQ